MAGSQTLPTLDEFDISEKTGFVPERPPLPSLPPYFRKWEDAVGQLSKLLQDKQLRRVVEQLPVLEFSEKTLDGTDQWRRALVVVSFLFQGYMWQDGQAGVPDKMPSILSVPMHSVTKKFGVSLVGVYAGTSLYNWRLEDGTKPLSHENMRAVVTYTGKEDESWFYANTLQVEIAAAPALKAMLKGLAAQAEKKDEELAACLSEIATAVKNMEDALKRVNEGCKPSVFFAGFLPFFSGSISLPNGMIYDGVDAKPHKYHNFTAAQSSSVKALDFYLGVQHIAQNLEFLDAMMDYMPQKHREFLQFLSKQPSLRQYVVDSRNDPLIKCYNSAVEAFVSFRSYHVIVVTKNVINQIAQMAPPPPADGGKKREESPLIRKLKSIRDSTSGAMIN